MLGEGAFQVGFLEGFRRFLAVTMLMQLVNAVFLPIFSDLDREIGLISFAINVCLLRYFLELEWYELSILAVVMGPMNLAMMFVMISI